jgi:hypothetical protein
MRSIINDILGKPTPVLPRQPATTKDDGRKPALAWRFGRTTPVPMRVSVCGQNRR